MDTLRWILLAVGVLVIAGLFGYYKWQERQGSKGRRSTSKSAGVRRSVRGDRDVEAALRDMDDFLLDDGIDEAADLPDLEAEPDDAPVGRARVRTSHHETVDNDSSVGPVRVRSVADDVGAADFSDALDEEPADAWNDDFEPEYDEAPDAYEDESDHEREEGGWNLGPVRIPRPSWVKDAGWLGGDHGSRADSDAQEDDQASYEDAVAQAVGEKIIVLHVHAGEGMCFTADGVSDALEQVGLRLGQHEIFHRHVETRRGEEPMFSVASMVKPGTLDPSQPETLETPGLALFMQLPGPFDGLSGFEQMLETARRLADQLDGHLLDGKRCDLTAQSVEHIREDLREYRRLAHLAARKTRA
ncbi:cell division protein ZipA [Aquisalimonas asiatica]|uniref:Cell division protein ZipA n=1 Tax=Aquisalimonas asiatica TaxID=406100 RepID=A0A1H8UKP6_9GAMM|nr:cell division protein ZipA [Aquisalimonas asiatica]SEP03745.1 cell division protein ZipA [Aquisalimonas asiatica]